MRSFFKTLKWPFVLVFFVVVAVVFLGVTKLMRAENGVSAEKGEKNNICIAMAADNKYIYPTLTAMTSIMENKNKDSVIEFNILLSDAVDTENREKFNNFVNLYEGCTVRLFDVKNNFSSAQLSRPDITMATYLRLYIPSILSDRDKVLYLDGDIMVRHDLWDLFSTDMSGCHVAGVRDKGPATDTSDYHTKLGVKDSSRYVNAGVLLMNTESMRKIEQKCLDFVPTLQKRGLHNADQDVINAVCYDGIKILNPTYNVTLHCFDIYKGPLSDVYKDCCDESTWRRLESDPTILHYSGPEKPWIVLIGPLFSEYKKYQEIVNQKLLTDGHPVNYGVYSIVSGADSDYAVDVEHSQTKDGARVWLWSRNGTNAQKFRLICIDRDEYEVEPMCSGKRVDVQQSGEDAGVSVWQYAGNGTKAQRFYIKNVGGNCYTIQSKYSGLYLDTCDAEVKDGASIRCRPKSGTDTQKFKFIVA